MKKECFDKLTCTEIKRIVYQLSDELPIRMPTPQEIEYMCDHREQTIIISAGDSCLWVDPEYIAYSLYGMEIIYLYATAAYIKEQRKYYAQEETRSKGRFYMPLCVRYAFDQADAYMKITHGRYWVDSSLRRGCGAY